MAYAVAVLGAFATGFIRHALDPIWGSKFPFTAFYPAVALAAWLGGLGPGLLATVLATIGALWFMPNLGASWRDSAPDWIALTLFLLVNVFISVLSEALHRARRRVEVALDSQQELLGIAERAADTVRRVQRVTDVVLRDLPLDQLLHEVLGRVRAVLPADLAAILLSDRDDGDGVLRIRAKSGIGREVPDGFAVPVGQGFAGQLAKERRAIVWNDVKPEEVFVPCRKTVRAFLGVPLLSEERLLGVLLAGSVRPNHFHDDDIDLLQLAGEKIALGIERSARTDAEHRARETLEASHRVKDEFLAMLAHELRNPVAAIQSAVTAARLDDSRRERALEIARRQVDQLGRLVDDLLDVARITRGQITLRKRRISVAGIIQGAVETIRPLVEERNHHLSVALPTGEVFVEADPARAEQIIVNLLTNAAKYTDPGGKITVTVERQGPEVAILVRDSGMGILPEVLPYVFDLFKQSPRALDRAQGGLGVGLTVARRLVELHGGKIDAHSEGAGRGAEFVVRLPVVSDTHQVEIAAAGVGPPPQGGRARIILVEDNRDTAEGLTMLLELLGHRVRIVHDGVTAVEVAQANIPDVMLIDIGLPGIDGYEVARRVREHPKLKHVVLVALTGYGREEDRERALAAGFDYHVVKPVSPEALEELVAGFGKSERKEPRTIH